MAGRRDWARLDGSDLPLLPGYKATRVGEMARPLPQLCGVSHGIAGLALKVGAR
jgi:hypothetical protein